MRSALWLFAATAFSATAPLELVSSVECVSMRGAKVTAVTVDPLVREVAVKTPSPRAVAARFDKVRGGLCRVAERSRSEVLLRCESSRVVASLARCGVELRQTRGVLPAAGPYRVPSLSLPLMTPPPGSLSVPTREAELIQADEAIERGELMAALTRLSAIGPSGTVGRLAAIRQCELEGTCVPALFDGAGLPEPMWLDARLRELRWRAFRGELEVAAAMGEKVLARAPGAPAERFLQQIAHAALRSSGSPDRSAGLSLFLALRERQIPDLPVVTAAAEAAAALGAPLSAANILSAHTPHVPRAALGTHLERAVALYELADAPGRAEVVRAFAREKLGRRIPRVKPPARVRKPAPLPTALPSEAAAAASSAALDLELAAAAAELARVRAGPKD